ncbi:hypothetical protein BH09ACT6_BH09ACT6_00210 [soil metagenome]
MPPCPATPVPAGLRTAVPGLGGVDPRHALDSTSLISGGTDR